MVILASNLISASQPGGVQGIQGAQGTFAGSANLNALTDVVIGTPNALTTGDILAYDGSDWINDPVLNTTIISLNTILDPITRQTDTTQIVAISVGTTPPAVPAVGDLWIDTN